MTHRLLLSPCSFLLNLLATIIAMPSNSSVLIFYRALISFFLMLASRYAKFAFESASLTRARRMITRSQTIFLIRIMIRIAPMLYRPVSLQIMVSSSNVLKCLTTTEHLMIFVTKLRALSTLLSNTYRQDTLLHSGIARTYKTDLQDKEHIVTPAPTPFDKLTPIHPDRRITLETGPAPLATRLIDIFVPLGFGQRALVVAPPQAGKTTILRQVAAAV